MGIDDQHVQRVIQWKAKSLGNLDTLIQRFGRCARDPNIQGLCILYYEKDCAVERVSPPQGNKVPACLKRKANGGLKTSSTAVEKRGRMESGLYRFINPLASTTSNGNTGTISCRRKIILGYYADQQYHELTVYCTKCCHLCGTDELTRSEPQIIDGVSVGQKPKKTRLANASSELQSSIKSMLYTVRNKILQLEYPNSGIRVNSQIIGKKQIELISSKCQNVAATGDLCSIPGLIIDELLAKYGRLFKPTHPNLLNC